MYYRELSSIRGIAAFLVVIGHAFSIIDRHYRDSNNSLSRVYDAIGNMFNGQAAVEVFFVLSGLVLSLSLERSSNDRRQWVTAFYVRRLFRVYPALWMSLALTLVLLPLIRDACAPGMCTDFALGASQKFYSLNQILLSFAAIYVHLNSPMWSLRVELLYSLIFPAIFYFLRHPWTRLPTFLFFLTLALLPISRSYSLHYGLAFVLGSAIPLLRIDRTDLPFRLIALAALATLIFSRQLLVSFMLADKAIEVVEIWAAFVLIFSVFHRKVSVGALTNPTLFYIGEISYSIYILHFPLLFALLWGLRKAVGLQAIINAPGLYTLVLTALVMVVVSALSALNFRYIELPFQMLGRAMSGPVNALKKSAFRQKSLAGN